MAEVIHRYVSDPEAKRGLARRGIVSLRREQTAHEKTKRMRLEMQLAVERGELIRKDLVEKQAGFLLVAMRQRAMSAPSAWSRRLLGINDARVMTERLRDMMASVLEDLSNLPEKVTKPDWVGDEDAAPLRQDGVGLDGARE
jgi:hypothetical protein